MTFSRLVFGLVARFDDLQALVRYAMAFMARARAIVGIGEIMLVASDGNERPGGVAAVVPHHAVRLGRRAVAIARIGQDGAGDQILAELASTGVETQHVQRDPDLDTARLGIRRIAGRETQTLDSRAAFDNLQWDFDLEDMAQQTDAVVTTLVGRRHGQTGTTIDRYLAACAHGLKVLDLVSRAEGQTIERSAVSRMLERLDALIVDREAFRTLVSTSGDEDDDAALLTFCRRHQLAFVVFANDAKWTIATDAETHSGREPIERQSHFAALAALLHGLLSGWNLSRSVSLAERYARFATENPDDHEVPQDFLS